MYFIVFMFLTCYLFMMTFIFLIHEINECLKDEVCSVLTLFDFEGDNQHRD